MDVNGYCVCGTRLDGGEAPDCGVREHRDKARAARAQSGRTPSPCGAQDWATDDDNQPFVYGTCGRPAGHEGGWHQQLTPSGKVWAEWRGPHDARAPEGARDGFLGGGPHDARTSGRVPS